LIALISNAHTLGRATFSRPPRGLENP
jgi:hypothetical protein